MAQLGYNVSAAALSRRLAHRRGRREVFVAESDGVVVAWAAVAVDETFVEGFGAQLEGLVVDESVRGRGIGAALLDAVERFARDRGCGELRILSNVVRERAHAFYRRCGYETVKTQRNLRKQL
jgi:GNAT superfamily N-acetyltransferase